MSSIILTVAEDVRNNTVSLRLWRKETISSLSHFRYTEKKNTTTIKIHKFLNIYKKHLLA